MKRLSTTFFLLLILCLTASALRPRKRAIPVRQSDGTTMQVYFKGDGHTGVAFYSTTDGIALLRNAQGDYCYARPEGNHLVLTDVLAHSPEARDAAERSYVSRQGVNMHQATQVLRSRRRQMAQPNRVSEIDGLGTYGKTGGGEVNSIGEYVIPVVMVEFSDTKFQASTTKEKLQDCYNAENYKDASNPDVVGSARDYFVAQSGGMFKPDFRIVAKVRLRKDATYYGADNGDEIDVNLEAFVTDAIDAAVKAGVKFQDYVQGGGVPCVVFIYAGKGEATAYYEAHGEDYIWPCEFSFGTYGDLQINSVFVGNEIECDYDYEFDDIKDDWVAIPTGEPYLAGIGTFCHEFGHALGLPDFYCADYSHVTDPFSLWDIMDSGAYVKDGFAPIGYTAYERCFMGWQRLYEPKTPESITLVPFEKADETSHNAMLIRNDAAANEYYVLENRQPGTWYPKEMGNGLLVQHYCYDAQKWFDNTLNNDEKKLLAHIVPADGELADYDEGEKAFNGDLFPGLGGKKNTLSASVLKAYKGTNINKPVFRIALDGENVTFNYLSEEISSLNVGDRLDTLGLSLLVTNYGEFIVTKKSKGKYEGDVTIPATILKEKTLFTIVGIDTLAFANCSALKSVDIPSTVREIAANSFRNSNALRAITVDANSKYFESRDGVLFTNEKALGQTEPTVEFNFSENNLHLPVSTTSGDGTGNLNEPVTFGGITMTATKGKTTPTRMYQSTQGEVALRIYKEGTLTFESGDGLITRIVFTQKGSLGLKASVGTLSGSVWTGEAQSVTFTCTDNTQIYSATISAKNNKPAVWTLVKAPAAVGGVCKVPEGVQEIAPYAFEGGAYTEVSLPATLMRLGEASLGLPALVYLNCAAEVPPVSNVNPFVGVNQKNCLLQVPTASVEAYQSATFWRDFGKVTRINEVKQGNADGNDAYDLQGRRVAAPQSGVYIIGGRKVLR